MRYLAVTDNATGATVLMTPEEAEALTAIDAREISWAIGECGVCHSLDHMILDTRSGQEILEVSWPIRLRGCWLREGANRRPLPPAAMCVAARPRAAGRVCPLGCGAPCCWAYAPQRGGMAHTPLRRVPCPCLSGNSGPRTYFGVSAPLGVKRTAKGWDTFHATLKTLERHPLRVRLLSVNRPDTRPRFQRCR